MLRASMAGFLNVDLRTQQMCQSKQRAESTRFLTSVMVKDNHLPTSGIRMNPNQRRLNLHFATRDRIAQGQTISKRISDSALMVHI
jgi:hypothetical protein